jgi:exonuclease VII large subunit
VLAIGSAETGSAARLAVLTARLTACDPARPLAEGFALVRDDAGALVQSAGSLPAGMLLSLEFRDGVVAARVEEEA